MSLIESLKALASPSTCRRRLEAHMKRDERSRGMGTEISAASGSLWISAPRDVNSNFASFQSPELLGSHAARQEALLHSTEKLSTGHLEMDCGNVKSCQSLKKILFKILFVSLKLEDTTLRQLPEEQNSKQSPLRTMGTACNARGVGIATVRKI